jgi:antitoxin component of MazEF toxin-antitoxin module
VDRVTDEGPLRMAHITRLIELGGVLVIQVPQQIRRQLALAKRDYVVVRVNPQGDIVATPLEDYLGSRRRRAAHRAIPSGGAGGAAPPGH